MNVGTVLYSHGENVGTPDAEWYHDETGRGYGFAEGGNSRAFEGKYKISYYDINGNLLVVRDLVIEKKENYYLLRWLNNGTITAEGRGIETEGKLSAGWINI